MSGETENRGTKSQNGFEETIRDFWASRPRRPHSGRKVAGVAAAIGSRYGIDPVIVRVAFVAATIFGGAGPLLYILGWLFFPDERDQVSAFEGMIGRGRVTSASTGFTVVLCIAMIPLAGWTFSGGLFSGGFFGSGGVICFVLFLAGLYALHHSRGQSNRPVVPAAGYEQFGQTPAYGQGGFDAAFSMSGTESAAAAEKAAPGWDPLGAAPFAWDLPDPEPAASPTPPPPPPPVPRHRSKVAGVTYSIAVVVAAVGVLLNLSGNDWFSAHHIIGMTLGVLGLGLVAGSFVRGGRGLIGLAIPLAIAGMVLTAVPFDNVQGGFGNINATPKTAAEVLPSYSRTAGNIYLDLTKLPANADVKTKVTSGAGQITVMVPATADVTYTCDTKAGELNCFNHHTSGLGQGAVTGTDLGTDGAGGAKINLDVEHEAGRMVVGRG
jgi:phage shock protein PspC (stress-responsive transcriptional regulator)